MNSTATLVVYYHRNNKNSLRILLGSLEKSDIPDRTEVVLCRNRGELYHCFPTLLKKGPLFLLVSLTTLQIWETYDLVQGLRELYGDSFRAIAGGPQASGDPRGTLKLGFDIVVRGEAEKTFENLLRTLLDQDLKLEDVSGIVYRDGDSICDTGPGPRIDLDESCPYSKRYRLNGYIEISRGCPFCCSYCQTPAIFGRKQRHRSLENLFEHLRFLSAKGIDTYRFMTPNALTYGSSDGRTANHAAVEQLLAGTRAIVGSSSRIYFGSFPSEIRPELITPQAVRMLKKYIDNDNLVIGAQSGSQKILDSCHRGHDLEDVRRAVALTHEAGLKSYVDIIFGFPEETIEDAQATISLMKELADLGARIHAHYLLPLPQTKYETVPPRELDPVMIDSIKAMIVRGDLFGQWLSQKKMSQRISDYFRTRHIAL